MKHLAAGIRVAFGLGIALALLSLVGALPATANPAGTGLVISQVYGAGGNASATYNADYVELFNPTSAPISLNGWSIQYASATGTGNFGASTTQLTELPNVSIPAGKYYLVQEASGTDRRRSAGTGPDRRDADRDGGRRRQGRARQHGHVARLQRQLDGVRRRRSSRRSSTSSATEPARAARTSSRAPARRRRPPRRSPTSAATTAAPTPTTTRADFTDRAARAAQQRDGAEGVRRDGRQPLDQRRLA